MHILIGKHGRNRDKGERKQPLPICFKTVKKNYKLKTKERKQTSHKLKRIAVNIIWVS